MRLRLSLLAAALSSTALAQTIVVPAACSSIEVIKDPSGTIVVGDPYRRAVLPSNFSSCTWSLFGKLSTIEVTVDWAYLGSDAWCSEADETAYLSFESSDGEGGVCWQQPSDPLKLTFAGVSNVLVSLEITDAAYAYGIGLRYCIGSACASPVTSSPSSSRSAHAVGTPSQTPSHPRYCREWDRDRDRVSACLPVSARFGA